MAGWIGVLVGDLPQVIGKCLTCLPQRQDKGCSRNQHTGEEVNETVFRGFMGNIIDLNLESSSSHFMEVSPPQNIEGKKKDTDGRNNKR